MLPVVKPTRYDLLLALPEGLTGEILNGQIHTQPRPGGKHAYAVVRLDRSVGRRYDDGDGGPGGWWILMEPELHLVRDTEVAVPDLAGWRRERMPVLPEDHRFEVVPDWVCEVLSPSTASKDREIKMPLYARYRISWLWLVDPKRRTLEVYALEQGRWRLSVQAEGNGVVTAVPFTALALELATLWC